MRKVAQGGCHCLLLFDGIPQRQFHFGSFQGQSVFQKIDRIQILFFERFVRLQMIIRQRRPNLGIGVPTFRLGMDARIGNVRTDLRQCIVQNVLSFQIGQFKFALVQNQCRNGRFVFGTKGLFQIDGFGKLSFGDVGKDAFGLQHFGQVLFKTAAIIHDFVPITSNFKSFPLVRVLDNGDIGQFDLIDRLIDLTGHEGEEWRMLGGLVGWLVGLSESEREGIVVVGVGSKRGEEAQQRNNNHKEMEGNDEAKEGLVP